MSRNRGPQMPDTMTGGVDLTGSVDLDEAYPDTLNGLNRQPEVLQTMTGGHGSLAGSVSMPDDPREKFYEEESIRHGLHEVAAQYDGTPVRVLPASRFRTMRYSVAPGSTLWIAQRDARRTSICVSITDPLNGNLYGYVGSDLSSVLTTGFELQTGSGAPYLLVMTHGDNIAFGARAANASAVTVSVGWEVAE